MSAYSTPPKTCESCNNCLLQDEGYSNYTVEGTVVRCMEGAHPEGDFDRWYGEDWRLMFANWCPKFSAGAAETLDVDREDFGELTPRAQAFVS